jgi:hypothetical protein
VLVSTRAAPERCEARLLGLQCVRPQGHDPVTKPHLVVESNGQPHLFRRTEGAAT